MSEDSVRKARERAERGNLERGAEKLKSENKLFVRDRLALLLDEGSFVEDALLANASADVRSEPERSGELNGEEVDDGVMRVRGRRSAQPIGHPPRDTAGAQRVLPRIPLVAHARMKNNGGVDSWSLRTRSSTRPRLWPSTMKYVEISSPNGESLNDGSRTSKPMKVMRPKSANVADEDVSR
ncbi:MAG: hypothetical protein FJW86_07470 [Actinobacteria bacterium]|nr:hypothetical protein [Actinomycetota bacterium]